jgi:hypothetical protein
VRNGINEASFLPVLTSLGGRAFWQLGDDLTEVGCKASGTAFNAGATIFRVNYDALTTIRRRAFGV